MTDPDDPLETRLREYLADLAEHSDSVPESRFLPQRPGPRRVRMGRPSRAGLVRALAAVCVVALVALIAAVALRAIGRNARIGGPDEAVLLTAAPVPVRAVFPEPAGGLRGERLMVFDSVTRATRQVGPAAPYSHVALSPRGDLLAALAGDTLHVANVSTGRDRSVGLGSGTHGSALVWSPDDAEVAVVGEHIDLVSATGTRVADVAPASSGATAPEPTGPAAPSGTAATGGDQWSPDGHSFAGILGAVLIVIGTDGRTASATLQRLLPGDDQSASVTVAGWNSSDDVVLGRRGTVDPNAPTLAQGWTVRFSGELRAIPGSDLAFRSTIAAAVHPASQSALDRFAAHAQVLYSHRTADGNADFYEVQPGGPSQGGASATLVIFVRGSTEAVRLPSLTDVGHSDLVDAVLAR